MHGLDMVAIAGAAVSWWGVVRYLLEIRRGNTKPRLASWIAWTTANGVLTAVALIHHNYTAAMFNALSTLSNVAVLGLSAYQHAGRLPQGSTDWGCLGASVACVGAIVLFPHAMFADALLAMTANLLATWPTMQHAWMNPRAEAWQLFAANGAANLLGLVGVGAVGGMSLANTAGPLVSMVGNVALVLITVGRSWLTTVTDEVEHEIAEAEQYIADLEGVSARGESID